MTWALTFFVTAIVSALLGFTDIAGDNAWVGKLMFFLFLILTLVALVNAAHRPHRW